MIELTLMSVLTLCVIFVLVILTVQALFGNTPENYPPGPTPWPLVQNLPNIIGGDGFYSNILKLRQRFGDVFRLKLGKMSMIIVFGESNVKELLVDKGDLFKYRPNWLYVPDKIVGRKGRATSI